jgi:centrosomal protein CEP350
LDTSATEDELEKSLRSVLPSESQRKRLKSESIVEDSLAASFSSDDFNNSELSQPCGQVFILLCSQVLAAGPESGTLSPNRRLSFEGDSFSRFTVEMVRQYMQEEEIRAQHQVRMVCDYSKVC